MPTKHAAEKKSITCEKGEKICFLLLPLLMNRYVTIFIDSITFLKLLSQLISAKRKTY